MTAVREVYPNRDNTPIIESYIAGEVSPGELSQRLLGERNTPNVQRLLDGVLQCAETVASRDDRSEFYTPDYAVPLMAALWADNRITQTSLDPFHRTLDKLRGIEHMSVSVNDLENIISYEEENGVIGGRLSMKHFGEHFEQALADQQNHTHERAKNHLFRLMTIASGSTALLETVGRKNINSALDSIVKRDAREYLSAVIGKRSFARLQEYLNVSQEEDLWMTFSADGI